MGPDLDLFFDVDFNYDLIKDYDHIVLKTNEETKEEDYADTADINTTIYSPITVSCVGSLNSIVIKFYSKYKKPNKYVEFYGEFYHNKKNYRSKIYKLDLIGFLNIAMKSAYIPDAYIDDMEEIKQLKEKVIADFAEDLFEENIILGNFSLDGLGFIEAENKKILAFNKLSLDINKNNMTKINTLNIGVGNCVGIANLSKVNNYKVYFLTDKFKIELNEKVEMISNDESYLKHYMFSTSNIKITKEEHEIASYDEKDIEEYVTVLSSLLDNVTTEEKHIDSTFDDDFF